MIRRAVLGLLIVGVVAAVYTSPASIASTSPCATSEWAFTSPGKSVFRHVTVPSVAMGSDQAEYPGVIVEPKSIRKGKRKVPGVVLLHGLGGDLCGMWWGARLLASHGYIALVVSMDPGVDVDHDSAIADVAARSSVSFLRGQHDPYRAHLAVNTLGLVGHSQGSMGASRAQSELPAVKAIVGMDNLRAFGDEDPGGPRCEGGTLAITPTVPGLGIGSETGCGDQLSLTDKLAGFHAWRLARIAAMEVVLRDSSHPAFGGGGPRDSHHLNQLEASGYYMRAWFDLWLKGEQGAYGRLLSTTPLGVPIAKLLTAKTLPGSPAAFHSAAFLPALHFHCENLRKLHTGGSPSQPCSL